MVSEAASSSQLEYVEYEKMLAGYLTSVTYRQKYNVYEDLFFAGGRAGGGPLGRARPAQI